MTAHERTLAERRFRVRAHTYNGFTTGQAVIIDGKVRGTVTHPGGGNGTHPDYVAVRLDGFTAKYHKDRVAIL